MEKDKKKVLKEVIQDKVWFPEENLSNLSRPDVSHD